MKRQVWADEQVMRIVNDAFIPVEIDVANSDATATLSRFGINSTPTTIITDSDGKVLQHQPERMNKTEFLELLNQQ